MIFFQDLRYAFRTASRDRAFSLVAVLTLALGIGANTALFTIVHAVVLSPLPFRNPERLVRVTIDFTAQHVQDVGLSIPELFDLRRADLFDDLAGVWPVSANLTETDEPERIEAAIVDANYFSMLGIGAQLGRLFGVSDGQTGITEVAVISDALWRRRFGGDPGVLGRRIRIDNDMYSIIGVAPRSFRHPGRGTATDVQMWAPAGWLAPPFPVPPVRRGYVLQGGLGRLKAGVTPAIAQQRVNVLAERLRQRYLADYPAGAGWAPRVIPLHDDLVGDARPALLTLLAAVGCVLLIACANVANLLLARSSVRQREFAIRRALGAGRWRIVGQLLTESVLLAVVGGALGLVVALWGVDLLVQISPAGLPGLHAVGVDATVLAFTAALSVVTGIVFGLAPAIQGGQIDLHPVMNGAGRSASATQGAARMRAVLVVAEFALALVLLVGAGLLVQSFWRLQRVDLGFNPSSVLTARLWLPQPNDPRTGPYFTHAARASFYRRVIDRVAALPGVQAVGAVTSLPLGGTPGRASFTIEGRPPDAANVPVSEASLVTPGYFSALGVELVRGRVFDDHDDESAPIALVVSESFARQFLAGEDAIGQRLVFGGGGRPSGPPPASIPWLTIVGIVRDVKSARLEASPAPLIYRSLFQTSNLNLTLVVRTRHDPAMLAESIRRAVRAVDPNEPVFGVQTMDAVVSSALAERRFTMRLLALFAVTALVLSAIGIYGVMTYFVTQRTHEIGIRMALGASTREVVAMVLGQGVRLAGAGVVAGVTGALLTTRVISALLFGVSPRDPWTLGALSATLTAVALLACYVPARRATRVDPIRALRYE
jgi:putative ABC transport system permease protein